MSLVFNMVGGGSGGGSGPSASDAILTVTVPTGSTVTMTKGGVTLTPTMWVQAADPTLDCALFVIASSLFDSQNAWTVTATLVTDIATDTVIIDSNKEYDLKLSFKWLYKDGNECVYKTGGWEVKKEGSTYLASKEPTYLHLNSAGGNGQSISTVEKVDLSNFSSICFTLKDAVTGSGGSNYGTGVVWANESGPGPAYTRIAETVINRAAAGTELSIDISSLNAAYKVGFVSWNSFVFNIDKVWLA